MGKLARQKFARIWHCSLIKSVRYSACSVWDFGMTRFAQWNETERRRTILHRFEEFQVTLYVLIRRTQQCTLV